MARDDLHDPATAVSFYDERYSRGYMGAWPRETTARIAQVIRELPLPASGRAIDFGCGAGVLTDVLRQALPPGWSVTGTDISSAALRHARRRFPLCTFLDPHELEPERHSFDFLFTHHVLEHVHDFMAVTQQMDALLAPQAAALHILPCGNPGSLEHRVCLLRTDGIDAARERRFFFEEEGHLRRLDTARLTERYRELGFELDREFYANQYHGAIDFITQQKPSYILGFTDSTTAVDADAARELNRMRRLLALLWISRFPAALVERQLRLPHRTWRDVGFLLLGLPLYPFTKPMDILLKRRAAAEWQQRRTDPGGAEMFLFFRRAAQRAS